MRDVAEQAGVSFKTVSRVINDEGGVKVDLVVRVRQAVDLLGYRRDDRARRLRQGGSRTGTIGFVLVDVANPFFSAILRGIEEVARSEDYLVFAGSSDGLEDRQNQLVEAFVARRVDADSERVRGQRCVAQFDVEATRLAELVGPDGDRQQVGARLVVVPAR